MDTLLTPAALTALIAGYLLGTIPFGLLLTRAFGKGDVRDIGSGNIGATNVLRTGSKPLAAATLILDILKGTLATVVAYAIATWFGAEGSDTASGVTIKIFPWMVVCVGGFGAFLGHVFPIWLGFKGGKGVATYLGILIGIAWPIAIVFCAAWLITAFASRYSSAAALVASLAALTIAMVIAPPHVAALCAFITALLIWKHAANIKRLVNGQEPKIGATDKT